MTRLSICASLAVAVLATTMLAACGQQTSAPPEEAKPQATVTGTTTTDAVAEIRSIEMEMETLFNSPEFPKNPSIVHKYFAPNATQIDIMEPGRFEGEAFFKHLDEIGMGFLGKVEFRNLNVQVAENMGYVEYIQYLVGKDVKGNPYEMPLHTTDIFRKLDGKWLIVHEHVTLPMNMETLIKVMSPKQKQ